MYRKRLDEAASYAENLGLRPAERRGQRPRDFGLYLEFQKPYRVKRESPTGGSAFFWLGPCKWYIHWQLERRDRLLGSPTFSIAMALSMTGLSMYGPVGHS